MTPRSVEELRRAGFDLAHMRTMCKIFTEESGEHLRKAIEQADAARCFFAEAEALEQAEIREIVENGTPILCTGLRSWERDA